MQLTYRLIRTASLTSFPHPPTGDHHRSAWRAVHGGDARARGAADAARVPAGAALAVDRVVFSQRVTDTLARHPLITIAREEVTSIPGDGPVIIATGPLTSDALSAAIREFVGRDHLAFYDAISPIVLAETIDLTKVFRASRWDRSLRGHSSTADAATAGAPGDAAGVVVSCC